MKQFWRFAGMLLVSVLCLQLFFAARIALMAVVSPQSTTFQRSEAMRLLREKHQILWSQQWVDDALISRNLKRAVIASEDAGFNEHGGVDWDALEKAWDKNQRAQEQADKRAARLAKTNPAKPPPVPKVIGGSTISQQLAKNLFLNSERHLARKGQELVLTLMLETMLSNRSMETPMM